MNRGHPLQPWAYQTSPRGCDYHLATIAGKTLTALMIHQQQWLREQCSTNGGRLVQVTIA